MYKYIAVIVISFVLTISALGFTEDIPSPFDMAKKYALQMPINTKGEYVWEFSNNSVDKPILYIFVYFPELKVILIGREPFLFSYSERDDNLGSFRYIDGKWYKIDKQREEVIFLSFLVFRELVEAGAI